MMRSAAVQRSVAETLGAIRRTLSVRCPFFPELLIALPLVSGVARALADFKPTLVHCATPFGVGLAGRRAARDVGAPRVTSYHTSLGAYAQYYGLGVAEAPIWR